MDVCYVEVSVQLNLSKISRTIISFRSRFDSGFFFFIEVVRSARK